MSRAAPRTDMGLGIKTGKKPRKQSEPIDAVCEFCGDAPASEPHHVAQGKDRAACDEHPDLQLLLCRECHDDLHDQKAKREMGLALLVRTGRVSIGRVMDLFWKVTQRDDFPQERKVRKWLKRLRFQKPEWRE